MTKQTEKPQRKVVQIAAFPATKHSCLGVVAVCDDGSLWIIGSKDYVWLELPPIPQEDTL